MTKNKIFYSIAFLLFAAFANIASAQEFSADSLKNSEITADTMRLSTTGVYAKKGPIGWLARYLRGTNKQSNKKFDMSLVFGPSYSATSSFMVGALACGVYSWDRNDPKLQKSTIGIFGAVGVKGLVAVGVDGKNFLPHDKWRINYLLSFHHVPAAFWGVGYTAARSKAAVPKEQYQKAYRQAYADYMKNPTAANKQAMQNLCSPEKGTGYMAPNCRQFSRIDFNFRPEAMYRFADNLYAGPMLDLQYDKVLTSDADLWRPDGTYLFKDIDGSKMPKSLFTGGVGVNISYDSRDVVQNPYKGVYLRVKQMYFPAGINPSNFGVTDISFSQYFKLWQNDCKVFRNAVLAYELHSQLTYTEKGANIPWTRLSLLGGSYRMRGYYEGQYRDNNIFEGQLELRLHVWSRSGIAVWGGFGNVWGREPFAWNHTLPNYGVGWRWELKKRINVRVDWGFTNDDWNVCFNINEAF